MRKGQVIDGHPGSALCPVVDILSGPAWLKLLLYAESSRPPYMMSYGQHLKDTIPNRDFSKGFHLNQDNPKYMYDSMLVTVLEY